MSDFKQHRRGFLGTSIASLLGLMPAASALAQVQASSHDEWLRGLNGKHRQFFDVGSIDEGAPLRRVHNFLATYRSAYGLKESEVNAVFGVHGAAIGFVMNHDAWQRFELGRSNGTKDMRTGSPARRNVFLEVDGGVNLPADAGITRLVQRGVRFLACRNTLTALAARIGGADSEKVLDDLVRSLLPGVTIVPAMLIAGNRAQEEGLTYASLG